MRMQYYYFQYYSVSNPPPPSLHPMDHYPAPPMQFALRIERYEISRLFERYSLAIKYDQQPLLLKSLNPITFLDKEILDLNILFPVNSCKKYLFFCAFRKN